MPCLNTLPGYQRWHRVAESGTSGDCQHKYLAVGLWKRGNVPVVLKCRESGVSGSLADSVDTLQGALGY
jgi:hypothetical protein